MHVAVVSLATDHHWETEATARLRELAQLLLARGHDVTVCCAKWWGGDFDTWTDEDTGLAYRAIAPSTEAGSSLVWSVPKALRSLDPDVVHAYAVPPVAAAAASLSGVPLVVEWYGDWDIEDGWWFRRLVGRADRFVVPSRLVETELRELGVDRSTIDVIPNPINMDRIRSVPPADEETHVVYSRRLDEAANLQSLLLALAEFRDRGWTATVVGEGPERADYERQARDLRIDDRVRFVGERTRDERIATYRRAHVFVQTAYECLFATELLWALACGCVGIVEYNADSSAHELVEGRRRGFRITSDDELVEAIAESRDLEAKDVDDDFESFDESAVLQRYIDLYTDLRRAYGLLGEETSTGPL